MALLRTALSLSAFSVSVFAALPASSGPGIERLVSGSAAPSGTGLVAGGNGARYELKGGSVVDVAAGTEFSFDPSLRIPLGKPGDPDTLTRVVRVAKGTV